MKGSGEGVIMKNNLKIVIPSALLVLCLVVSLALNSQSAKDPENSSGIRMPASWIAEIRSGTLYVERALASKIAEFRKRDTASIGRPADPLENLRFGILEGKYALTLDGGKISEISFIDNPNSEGRPTTISDRKQFIKEYASVFDARGTPERVQVDIQGAKIIETYRAKTSAKDSDLLVSFILDDLDRVLGIQTRKISNTKIF
jgi:hypothetical protein